MPEKIEHIELEEFIKKALLQIERGAEVGERGFKDAIEVEVSVSKNRKTGWKCKNLCGRRWW